jgi:predicted GNAT superfamily acetyltransferase
MVIDASAIEIRDIKEMSELKAVEDLQKEIWGCSDREILPRLALIPLLEIGGVLLGAFDGNDLIGFVLGFPGRENSHPILHSDMLAVKRAYRSHGLGYKLKLAQREWALAQGVDRITWTFDPLQSPNAHLNFAKLGVIADCYKTNYYGETSSFLHGAGTDRLWVTWLLNSENVTHKLRDPGRKAVSSDELEGAVILLQVNDTGEPVMADDDARGNALVLEIPDNINAIRRHNLDLARLWREATRQTFMRLFEAGYCLFEFYRVERNGRKIGRYFAAKR